MGVEHEDLVELLEGRLGSRQSARDAVGAFAGAILAEVASGGRPGFGVSDSVGSGAGGPVPRYRPGSAFREIVGAGPGARPADAQGDSAGRQPSRT